MQKRIKQENLNIDRTDVRLTSDYIVIYIYIYISRLSRLGLCVQEELNCRASQRYVFRKGNFKLQRRSGDSRNGSRGYVKTWVYTPLANAFARYKRIWEMTPESVFCVFG